MKRILILGGVLAALAVGIVAVAGAGAQEDTSEDRTGHYLELLADNLGVTVEELEGALTQSHLDLVNEKVADGTLTEEEAADIIERIESGEGRLFPPFGGGRHGGGHGNMQRLQAEYIEKGVVWLVVCSSAPGKEGYFQVAKIKRRMEAHNSAPSHYLLDPDGKVGRMYGARTTPHMYIIDSEGTLVYAGGIDDKPSTRLADIETAHNYVGAALDAAAIELRHHL